MKSCRLPILLALFLFLTMTATLPASPTSPSTHRVPVVARTEIASLVGISDRTTVVRFAALGMALGLFIMYWKKH